MLLVIKLIDLGLYYLRAKVEADFITTRCQVKRTWGVIKTPPPRASSSPRPGAAFTPDLTSEPDSVGDSL